MSRDIGVILGVYSLLPQLNQANIRHSTKVVPMLEQRRRRRTGIEPILCQRLVFAGILPVTLTPRWLNIGPPSTALAQP